MSIPAFTGAEPAQRNNPDYPYKARIISFWALAAGLAGLILALMGLFLGT